MANITFTIPSVLNQGGGEKKTEISADSLQDAFAKISEIMGDDFKRRVLEGDGAPRSLINTYINGKNAKFSGGMDTSLNDGDEVYILPAVAGGSEELSAKELDRFSRQVMLEEIGYQGQLKLKNAKVCVVGTGGLGNPITSRLAAMGIGTLRIVDRDVIELSNLHRQTMFDEDDVGQVKVEVAAKKLQKLREWITSGPFQIDRNEYVLGEKIFVRVGGLSSEEKGQIAFLRPLNDTHDKVYLTISFDGSERNGFNQYFQPQLSKSSGFCTVDDFVGEWRVVFRGTEYADLTFKITEDIIPGDESSYEPVC